MYSEKKITDFVYKDVFSEAIDKLGIRSWMGNSPTMLENILPTTRGVVFFYLDAHNPDCPLLDELSRIAKHCPDRAVIAIHDFVVPGKNFGYDSYNGHDLNFDFIKDALPAIYLKGFTYHYNDQAEGARRGIIYIEPK